MLKSTEDIVKEIDETLDRLLENQATLEMISTNPDFSEEKETLEKVQESLLAHLMHMDGLLKGEKQGASPEHIASKLSQFETLKRPRARSVLKKRAKSLL